ncbi:glycoside hydrolase family 172 protein [Rhodanobacter sp. L36]|uniref:glycoside hydrolase family 172 protein n=1 Tax=Rhodanobacter sp. L36 TaxID=1747221 RepID=UPI00131DB8C8|nr:glycoside hydrolase family 172 protein [Rhodanobacter sp. L36]
MKPRHAVWLFLLAPTLCAQSLYDYRDQSPRWISPENRTAAPGRGALENRGAKGHAFDSIAAGQSLELGRIDGAGVIRRIWMTISDRSPRMLRALRLEIFWDDAKTPAVSVPLGDFFGANLDGLKPFENALFSSPEGRSFNSIVPMPFRHGARLVLSNDSPVDLAAVFYDVDYTREKVAEDALYFHADWHRQNPTTLGEDFRILPPVKGRGRYLGASIAVITNSAYRDTWWGEGEVRIFLDGDRDHPTLVGTGTEDYAGSGYGLAPYIQRNQGAPVADLKTGHWSFYRFHLPDPVYFSNACEVRLQQIGGGPRAKVVALMKAGVPIKPVTLDRGGRAHFIKLLDNEPMLKIDGAKAPDGWLNFYRSDDVAATVYYYLDRPESSSPTPLAPEAQRVSDASTVVP